MNDHDQASPEYSYDISHASISSTQASACSVEPGSAEDLGKIVRRLYSDIIVRFLDDIRAFHIVANLGIKPNAFWRQRRRMYDESGIFLDERCTDRNVTLQRNQGRFYVWDS